MACAERRRLLVRAALALALGAAGCATLPSAGEPELAFPGVPASHDLRAQYRAAACARFPGGGSDCERIVLREAGERALPPDAPIAPASPTDAARRYRIGLVPGLFAQCLAPVVRAFGDVEPGLRARGFDVTYVDVPGRGTAARNAATLAASLKAAGDGPPYILVTYSKGLADALEYFVSDPEAPMRVAAIVSISGAARGSPLADAYESTYRQWLARLPMPGCERSDGSEIRDLRRDVRQAWWETNGAAVTVPVFSLVTMPRAERLSFGLRTAHATLAQIDARNDGKLLWSDQLVPGNYLLGFLNADHWAVATPLDQGLPLLGFLFEADLPRTALVEGAIDVAAAMLERERGR